MLTKHPSEGVGENAAECWECIQRIAASSVFHRATRIRELLLYLAERSLHGPSADLSEGHIADQVFQRKQYNPAEDNLVRASVRQLRLKLKEYFEVEGKDDLWVAELPKGSYQICFHQRSPNPPAFEPSPMPPARHEANRFRPSAGLFWVIALLAILSTTVAISLTVRGASAPMKARRAATLMDLLVGNANRPTEIVVIDSAFVLLQGFTGRDIGLEDYAARTYTSDFNGVAGLPSKNARELLDSRQITSFADVEIAAAISRDYGNTYPLLIRHARSMNVRDFKRDNNFLLIGSPLADPWAALFDRRLNFQFENHTGSWPVIRNRNPQEGERATYGAADSYSETGPQYARIAVFQKESGPGRVALIAGTSMEGTEAAGESFLNPSFAQSLAESLGMDRVRKIPDFEVVIQTEGVGGAGYGVRILAVRKMAAR